MSVTNIAHPFLRHCGTNFLSFLCPMRGKYDTGKTEKRLYSDPRQTEIPNKLNLT